MISGEEDERSIPTVVPYLAGLVDAGDHWIVNLPDRSISVSKEPVTPYPGHVRIDGDGVHIEEGGLTWTEAVIMGFLTEAWNAFTKLEDRSDQNTQEFLIAIHRAQEILGRRVLARIYPSFWNTP